MFWFNGWTVYLMKGVSNMAIKKYIGARYAPKFMGAWDKASEYAALSVVYTNEQSYVSRKTVPANTEITNTEFWIKSADWNAQVGEYRAQVEANNTAFNELNANVDEYKAQTDAFFNQTMHTYNTQADMQVDKTVKAGLTLMTSGKNAVGDGGGAMYQVVSETSASAVALQNGLWAKPFKFQAYGVFNRFQAVISNVDADTMLIDFSAASPGMYNIASGTIQFILQSDNPITLRIKMPDKFIGIITIPVIITAIDHSAMVTYTSSTTDVFPGGGTALGTINSHTMDHQRIVLHGYSSNNKYYNDISFTGQQFLTKT